MMSYVYKTRVFKAYGFWYVSYVLPYSGELEANFDTWQEAMNEACNIEQNRGWM